MSEFTLDPQSILNNTANALLIAVGSVKTPADVRPVHAFMKHMNRGAIMIAQNRDSGTPVETVRGVLLPWNALCAADMDDAITRPAEITASDLGKILRSSDSPALYQGFLVLPERYLEQHQLLQSITDIWKIKADVKKQPFLEGGLKGWAHKYAGLLSQDKRFNDPAWAVRNIEGAVRFEATKERFIADITPPVFNGGMTTGVQTFAAAEHNLMPVFEKALVAAYASKGWVEVQAGNESYFATLNRNAIGVIRQDYREALPSLAEVFKRSAPAEGSFIALARHSDFGAVLLTNSKDIVDADESVRLLEEKIAAGKVRLIKIMQANLT